MVNLIILVLTPLHNLFLENGFQILNIPGNLFYFLDLLHQLLLFDIFSAYIVASPSVVSLFEYSLIIMSMIPGYFLFNEIPTVRTFIGVACIITAGIYIYVREKARDQYIATETPVRR